ncbi:MAG: Gmad2 immunoglobulin-like domain-containing protein [bacterium]|nr:Gmad2 immunoglobulin-like domain-containing protein [bacterium]
MNKITIIAVIILVVIGGLIGAFLYNCEDDWCYVTDWQKVRATDSFVRCEQLGFPVMESYPRQCKAGGKTFVEVVEPILPTSYKDLINVSSPLPGAVINSPMKVIGSARGNWYFEASFPVVLTDWDGRIIAQSIATAKGDPTRADGASPTSNGAGWMTTEFVPFEATLIFTADKDAYSNKGTLILKKDNPSGLPQNDDAMEIPVFFEKINKPAGILPYDSGVSGTILLGPTCPVMRDPPDPQCADRPYATTITVHRAGSGSVFSTGKSDVNGLFKFSLPPGSYMLVASGGTMLPRCNETSIVVLPNVYTTTTMSCDTGIR